jgi:hypothetical protein
MDLYRGRAAGHTTVLLEPLRCSGAWDGERPFGDLAGGDTSGQVAVLTRATLRPLKQLTFWRQAGAVERELQTAEGLRYAVPIGELPLRRSGTFSIWDSSRAITVQGPPNQAPTARFTHTESSLQTSVNGTTSSDPDGTVAAYAWSWGDGTPDGSGATATHTYATTGSYTVTLTVTDDKGATHSTSALVSVGGLLASDTFTRSLTGGWGTADLGGRRGRVAFGLVGFLPFGRARREPLKLGDDPLGILRGLDPGQL